MVVYTLMSNQHVLRLAIYMVSKPTYYVYHVFDTFKICISDPNPAAVINTHTRYIIIQKKNNQQVLKLAMYARTRQALAT